jgi:hypothetical protein
MPSGGGVVSSWSCTDTASTDTPPVTGSDCVATGWEPLPTASPVATAPVASCGLAADAPCYSEPSSVTFSSFGLAAVLVVLLLSGLLVASLRRGGNS